MFFVCSNQPEFALALTLLWHPIPDCCVRVPHLQPTWLRTVWCAHRRRWYRMANTSWKKWMGNRTYFQNNQKTYNCWYVL